MDFFAAQALSPELLPKGHGHSVIAFPGLGASGGATVMLRTHLRQPDPAYVRQIIMLGTHYAELRHVGTVSTSRLDSEEDSVVTVPAFSIYSKCDGVVAWQGCVLTALLNHHAIAGDGVGHRALVYHPEALSIIAGLFPATLRSSWRTRRKIFIKIEAQGYRGGASTRRGRILMAVDSCVRPHEQTFSRAYNRPKQSFEGPCRLQSLRPKCPP